MREFWHGDADLPLYMYPGRGGRRRPERLLMKRTVRCPAR
jgi:hypothetical protein